MRRSIQIVITVCLLLLSASCGKSATSENARSQSPASQPVSPGSQSPTKMPGPSATKGPSFQESEDFRGETPTHTPTVTIPAPITAFPLVTPLPTARPISTVLRSCPLATSDAPFETDERIQNSPEIVLQALNQGIAPSQIIEGVNNSNWASAGSFDITGDGIPELLVGSFYHIYAFGCPHGQYGLILDWPNNEEALSTAAAIFDVVDMNANGIPEVILTYDATSGYDTEVDILEWDGQEFQRLILPDPMVPVASSRYGETNWYSERTNVLDIAAMNGQADIFVTDPDASGLRQLILTDYGPQHFAVSCDFGPWRGKVLTFSWNGRFFSLSGLQMDEPEYRFQAIQDADRLFLLGDYDQAVDMYQAAAFDKDLKWWSPSHQMDLARACDNQEKLEPTLATPPIDGADFPYLNAYARYRILLHHIARGWLTDALTVHDELVRKYPPVVPGNEFEIMADLLWRSFAKTPDLSIACTEVVAYAGEHEDALAVLGDSSHGDQSHVYIPQDMCPF